MKKNQTPLMILCGIALTMALSACGGSSQDAATLETQSNIASVLWMDQYNTARIPADINLAINSAANSSAAFGTRTQNRLADLLANPDNFTPDYTDRYSTLSAAATQLSAHQAYAFNEMLGLDSSRDYQELPESITFEFPQADQPQLDYQTGWHFFVGSAFAASGEEYGIQLMFWQDALMPPQMAADAGLTPIQNQMLQMHFAISKVGDRHYRAQPYIVAGTTGLVSISQNPFYYAIGKNFLLSQEAGSLFPLELRAWGKDETDTIPIPIEIDLTLTQVKNYILEGDQGLSPSCGGIGTLYYSVPDLQIDPTKSWLRINGQEARLTSGIFWYDHQWGTGFIPHGNARNEYLRASDRLTPQGPGGWDWMEIQFDDHTEITLSALHTIANEAFYQQTGPNPPGTMTADAKGLYIDESGNYSTATGHIQVTDWVRSTIAYGQYMATNTWYPNRVEVTVDTTTIPANRRTFTMVPIVSTGQQGFFAFGAQYSEGAVFIEDETGAKIGRGFLESTAYANSQNQMLELAGFPQTEAMRELLVTPAPITPELEAECFDFLSVPANAEALVEVLSTCKGL
jgi:predicted secreted hydrolase